MDVVLDCWQALGKETQGKRQTVVKSFDELTGHIRSILNGSDVNDVLMENWTFISMLVSLNILLPEDLRLHKDIKLLKEELSFLESLREYSSFIVYAQAIFVINCACVIDFVGHVVNYVFEKSLLSEKNASMNTYWLIKKRTQNNNIQGCLLKSMMK